MSYIILVSLNMIIGIDANVLTISYPCGVKNYGEMLIKSLSEIDSKNSYFLFTTKKITIPERKNFKLIILPPVPIFKRQILLPIYVRKYKIDVFHYLEPYGSVFLKTKNIITTVHDINLKYNYPLVSRHLVTRLMNEITRYFTFNNTDFFLLPTLAIKKELNRSLPAHKDRSIYAVIPEGINAGFKPKLSGEKSGDYILSMGDFSPRKNIKRLIESYSLIEKDMREKHNLLIICSTKDASQKYRQFIKTADIEKTAKVIIHPSTEDLAKLYTNACFFIYPSLYEGFGLPILEAMASGCPVVTSDYGAMKEVAGGAAILIDPISIPDILNAMIRLIKEKRLRDNLTKKGLKRSRYFSWKNTAKLTLGVYKNMFKSHNIW